MGTVWMGGLWQSELQAGHHKLVFLEVAKPQCLLCILDRIPLQQVILHSSFLQDHRLEIQWQQGTQYLLQFRGVHLYHLHNTTLMHRLHQDPLCMVKHIIHRGVVTLGPQCKDLLHLVQPIKI